MAPNKDRLEIARRSYQAFAEGDRSFFEEHLAADFSFSSPPDPNLDRDGWFERCWPGAGREQEFEFLRLVESGDEVVVTYELRRTDGSGGRNTEVLTFGDDDRIVRTEVYFGWDLPDRRREDTARE
jgi:ketosteroid isomerase-like protein